MTKIFKPFENKRVQDLKDMKIYDHVTHGDIVIYRVEDKDFPQNFAELPNKDLGVLAEGEHTGHAHQLFTNEVPEVSLPAFQCIDGEAGQGTKFELREAPDGQMFLKVENEPLLLKHQEHAPFRIYPGNYDIGIQQETDPNAKLRARVLD